MSRRGTLRRLARAIAEEKEEKKSRYGEEEDEEKEEKEEEEKKTREGARVSMKQVWIDQSGARVGYHTRDSTFELPEGTNENSITILDIKGNTVPWSIPISQTKSNEPVKPVTVYKGDRQWEGRLVEINPRSVTLEVRRDTRTSSSVRGRVQIRDYDYAEWTDYPEKPLKPVLQLKGGGDDSFITFATTALSWKPRIVLVVARTPMFSAPSPAKRERMSESDRVTTGKIVMEAVCSLNAVVENQGMDMDKFQGADAPYTELIMGNQLASSPAVEWEEKRVYATEAALESKTPSFEKSFKNCRSYLTTVPRKKNE